MMYAPTGLLFVVVGYALAGVVFRGTYLDFEQQIEAIKWIGMIVVLGVIVSALQYAAWVLAELAG